MSTKKQFKESLEMGTKGEDAVYPWLKANNSFVQNLRAHVHDPKRGPCLEGTDGRVVEPDFVVLNKIKSKGRYAIDVKVKTRLYTVDGKECFTVDHKFSDYKRYVALFDLDYLMILFIYEGRFYAYKDTEFTCITEYNNDYGSGPVYCFEFDKSKMVY